MAYAADGSKPQNHDGTMGDGKVANILKHGAALWPFTKITEINIKQTYKGEASPNKIHPYFQKKLQREKELSGRQIFAQEISSRRGEIVTINTVIKLDLIGIIIIHTIISTSTIITTPSRYNNCVESCIVLRGNFLGVDYYCS